MKLDSPKNMEGKDLLTGISAVNGTTVLGSDFKSIKNGTGVTITSTASGVMTITADISGVTASVEGKLDKPATNGTAGQVLKTSGGTGATYWGDALTTVAWGDVTSKPVVVAALPTASGTNGQILRAGANGTIAWQNVATTIASNTTSVVAGSAVWSAISAHAAENTHLPSTGTSGYVVVKDTNGYKLVATVASATNATSATSAGSVAWANITGAPSFITLSAVTALPTTNIKSNVIYLVPNSGTGSNVKDEYIYQNNAWELIGTLQVDVTNYESHISSTALHVPAYTNASNGKVLKVVNGVAKWDTDLTADGSAVLPSYDATNVGQILQITSSTQDGLKTAWVATPVGDMTKAEFVNTGGTGIVLKASSATNAGSATNATNAKYASSAGKLSTAVSIGNASFNGASSITIADMGVASASHSHETSDITSFNNKVSTIASSAVSTVASSVASSVTSTVASAVTSTVASAVASSVASARTSVVASAVTSTVASAVTSTVAGNLVKDVKITINQGGTSKGSFTLNQGTAGSVNLDAVKVSGTAITSIAAGTNVTLTVATNTVTISATDTKPNDKTVKFYAGASVASNSCGQITLNQNADSSIIIQSATDTKFGVVKVGTGLGSANGVISVARPVPSYTTTDGGKVLKLNAGGTAMEWGTTQTVTVSNAVTSNGSNPVAGSAIYSHVESKIANKAQYDELAQVAFTGDYNDLVSKPTWTGGNISVSGSTVTSLVAGTNVTLTPTNGTVTIAATGGGGGSVTIDNAISSNGSNPVAGSAIWSALSAFAYQISQL